MSKIRQDKTAQDKATTVHTIQDKTKTHTKTTTKTKTKTKTTGRRQGNTRQEQGKTSPGRTQAWD
jgi:hypothetical protein